VTRTASRLIALVSGPKSKLSVAAAGTVVATSAGAGIRFFIQLVLADVLGTTAYGRFAGLRGWTEFAAFLPSKGYNGTAVRFLPGYEATSRWAHYRGLLAHSLRLTVVRGILIGAAGFAIGLWAFDDSTLAVAMAMATIPGWALIRMMQSLLQAQHQFVWGSMIVQIGQPIIVGVGLIVFWVARSGGDNESGTGPINLEIALGLLAGSLILASLFGLLISRRSIPDAARQPEVGRDDELDEWDLSAGRQLRSQLAIAVIGVSGLLVLERFVAPEQVALYAIATRVAVLGRMVNSGVESIVSPRISAAWSKSDIAGVQRTVGNAIKLSTGPTVLIAAVLVIFRGPILGIIGDEYRAAGTVLAILLIGNVTNALTGPSGYVVALTGNEKAYARIMVGTAIWTLTGSLVVAASWGIVAVAIVRSMADVGWNLALLIFARRNLGVRCYPTRDLFRR
jgi:O-antigen/teichoic acid export membrane protein